MSMLKGKTALVTGSTSGIGLGIAKAFAEQGANIVMNGFGDSAAAISEVKALGVEVEYHGADMSKASEIEDMKYTHSFCSTCMENNLHLTIQDV